MPISTFNLLSSIRKLLSHFYFERKATKALFLVFTPIAIYILCDMAA